MNTDRFNGICKQLAGSFKQQWGVFIADPAVVAAGLRERSNGKLQERLGICAQDADAQLEDFMNRHRNWQDI